MENLGYVQMVHGAHAPKLERRISLDDWLYDGEIDRIAREREKLNGNGNHSAQQGFCDCPECRIGGRRYALHRVPSDCLYSEARGALVPEAERLATHIAGNRELNGQRWQFYFVTAMDELVRQHGLLNGSNGKSIANDTNEAIDMASAHHGNGSNNGSAAHNTAQDCEMNTGSLSSRPAIPKSVQDAAVAPMW
jgi:hypothetical protein